jgi:hypothetical protein
MSGAFNARVQSRFLIGSSQADMLSELGREKFTTATYDKSVSRYQFSAVRDLQGLPCRRDWKILWNSDAGKIAEIEGLYIETCL